LAAGVIGGCHVSGSGTKIRGAHHKRNRGRVPRGACTWEGELHRGDAWGRQGRGLARAGRPRGRRSVCVRRRRRRRGLTRAPVRRLRQRRKRWRATRTCAGAAPTCSDGVDGVRPRTCVGASHARNRAPTADQRRASTTPTSASANPASWTAASVSPNSR
jgi:GNAT superfamily N-acetyltransferase